MHPVLLGTLASLFAGLLTSTGGIFLFLKRKNIEKLNSVFLGLSAGIMFAASIFSLLVPALGKGKVPFVLMSFFLGALFIDILDDILPHEHLLRGLEGPSSKIKMVWLILISMVIHNLPEGMAVGIGFANGISPEAISLSLAIGFQNIPEGAAVALPLVSLGYTPLKAIFIAFLTGMIEPVGGFLGALMGSVFVNILPYLMSFASGAMIYVVSDEMIPESHKLGEEKVGTFAFIIGFILMTFLDSVL
ncbi:MAG: ZIP family metal transporter [candidate division WOR-3 bacterium]